MPGTVKRAAVFCAMALWAAAAMASTDEQKCLAGRNKAKSKFQQCIEKGLSKQYGGGALDPSVDLPKCRAKYQGAWTKLQGLSGSATCGGQPRFVDNGNGTILDNLTGLVWEKKSDDDSVHDKDTTLTWSTGAPYNGDGTVFTTLLAVGPTSLNNVGFAGANDWRLPTFAELQTILLPEPAPCTSFPCVDAVFNTNCVAACTVLTCSCTQPNFGHWSATTSADHLNSAWVVGFGDGSLDSTGKTTITKYARAVRGGL